MNGLSGAGNKKGVKAVLTDDISMPDGASMPQFNGEFFGTLDGKGHTISGLKLGTGSPHQGLSSLFNIIAKEGAVKNLIIDGWDAYVDEYMEDPHSDTAFGNALLARINKGTISGVTLKNCSLAQKIQGEPRTEAPELAGIAAYSG